MKLKRKNSSKKINIDQSALDSLSELRGETKDPEMAAAIKAIDMVSNVMESISKGSQVDLVYFNYYSKNMQNYLLKRRKKDGVRMQKKENGK